MSARRAGDFLDINCRDARDKVFGSASKTFDYQTVEFGAAALASEAMNLSRSEDLPTVVHRDAARGATKPDLGCYV